MFEYNIDAMGYAMSLPVKSKEERELEKAKLRISIVTDNYDIDNFNGSDLEEFVKVSRGFETILNNYEGRLFCITCNNKYYMVIDGDSSSGLKEISKKLYYLMEKECTYAE